MRRQRAARAGPRLEQITLEDAGVRLRGRWVLRDVAFDLRAGENWLLLGANGAGKTLLLRLLRGEIWPTPTGRERRRYLVDGEWHDQPLMARGRIAYLGPEQQDRYERHGWNATVAETVATGLFDTGIPLDASTAAHRRSVRRALEQVGLAGRAQRHFLSLSQGQRRRVLLARALVSQPDVLLLDEVLNGLDAGSRDAVLVQLRRLGRAGTAWVLSTHRAPDRPLAFTHVARLAHGRLLSAAPLRPARSAAVKGLARNVIRGAGARRDAGAGPGEPFIMLDNVSVHREGRRILEHLDWVVRDGEHWCVVGANGSGKSTLMALLYGDLAPASGGRILRRTLPSGSPIEDWKVETGLVSAELQATYAATACTVDEIVVSGLHSSIGLNEPVRAAELAVARRWIARVGLRRLGRRKARELSYGQLRLALLARALVRPRRLILLDEPFDGLDRRSTARAKRLLDTAAERGTQVIVATHHDADIPSYVSRRLVLRGVGAGERAASRLKPVRGAAGNVAVRD